MADKTTENINVDSIIAQLLEVRGAKPGRHVNLKESDIRGLCLKAREIFLSQPILLELEAPIKICGKPILDPFFVVSIFVESANVGLFCKQKRRHSRTISRFASTLRVWWIPS